MSLEKKWLRDLLIPVDYCRYLFWRLLRMNQQITLTLQSQQKIILRASDSLVSDRAVAREVFSCEAYQRPNEFPQNSPQFMVDIGANVGYSIIYLAYEYPNATFAAFEPHPQHSVLLEQNLRINRLLDKVNIEKEVPTGYQWYSERLRLLGYKITEGKVKYENAGILWAWKD